jgi:predicted HicB family RNase H-like nuclease
MHEFPIRVLSGQAQNVLQRHTSNYSRDYTASASLRSMEHSEKLNEVLSFRLSKSLRKRLEAEANRRERTVNWLIRRFLKEGIERAEKKPGN